MLSLSPSSSSTIRRHQCLQSRPRGGWGRPACVGTTAACRKVLGALSDEQDALEQQQQQWQPWVTCGDGALHTHGQNPKENTQISDSSVSPAGGEGLATVGRGEGGGYCCWYLLFQSFYTSEIINNNRTIFDRKIK